MHAQSLAGNPDGKTIAYVAGTLWLGAAAIVLALMAEPAAAQRAARPGVSNPGEYQVAYHNRRRYYRKRYRRTYQRPRAVKKQKEVATKPNWYPEGSLKDPIQLVVSIPDQKVTVYQGDKKLVTSRVSSGMPGYDTPTGVFTILQKNRYHRSNIYSRAPMPFMQRLTWSGIAFHGSNAVPNRPASHGCVRLPPAFASELFRFTEPGVHVIVAKRDTAPYEIEHDKLFQPSYPAPKDYDVVESERMLRLAGVKPPEKEKRSTSPVRILVTWRTGRERLTDVQTLLNELQFSAGDVDGWMGPDTASAIRRFQKTYGLTSDGLVSDELIAALHRVAGKATPKNAHIYVRQDFRQVFDAPIAIREPDKPLGAHIVTAMHFEPGDARARWLAFSLIAGEAEPRREVAVHSKETATDQPPPETPGTDPAQLRQALDRIEIPDDIRERISEMLTPGSSLAISDNGLSKETFPKGTDFVVLTD